MAKKKLTTEEILAAARGQDAGGKSESQKPSELPPETSAEPVAESQPASESSGEAEKPVKKAAPKSTADILAAARAETNGGGKKSGDAAEKVAPASKKPAAAGGKKPTSTADIMAALRAEAKGGAAGGSQPSAKSTPVKKTAPAGLPPGEKPSVQEMLRAVREGKPVSETSKSAPPEEAKPALPPMPTRPVAKPAAKPKASDQTTRRGALGALGAVLLSPFVLAWVAFSATSASWLLAAARFMFPNVLVEPPMKFKIGSPTEYPFGTVSTKWKAARGVWIVHSDRYQGRNEIFALASVCTHLGCTPNWLEGEQKFKCPCHGSGFYIDGINFEGPAPRPLERVGLRLAEDGMLEVDKSVKFQEELGQWADPSSFVEIV